MEQINQIKKQPLHYCSIWVNKKQPPIIFPCAGIFQSLEKSEFFNILVE